MNIAPTTDNQIGKKAFGEWLGIDVPTRYPEQTHTMMNEIMAADSAVTPVLLRMSRPTVWFCRGLAALLLLTTHANGGLALRQRLTIEATAGIATIIAGLLNMPRVRFLERCYLVFGGLLMVANALMTQTDE